MKSDFVNQQYKDFLSIADKMPFISNEKAVFYAGDVGLNEARAEKFAKLNGLTRISGTDAGRVLTSIHTEKIFSQPQYLRLWNLASRKFAYETKGEVKTFVAGATPRSIFRRVEMPALLNNKNVTSINGVDRAKINQFRHDVFNRLRDQGVDKRTALERANVSAHRRIAMSELRQDMSSARQRKDFVGTRDVRDRLSAFSKQRRLEFSEKTLGKIESNNLKRQEFSQDKRQKIAELREIRAQARMSGDRTKMIEANKTVSGAIKDLRGKNQQHAKEAKSDRQLKSHHRDRIDQLRSNDKSRVKPLEHTAQIKQDGSIKTQLAADKKFGLTTPDTRKQITQMIGDPEVKKINGYDRQRYEQIYDRGYKASISRGGNAEAAKVAGELRATHVLTKMDLLKEKTDIRQKPSVHKSKEYFSKDETFRAQRTKDLQMQASRENREYKGPQVRSPAQQEDAVKINSLSFSSQAKLDLNAKKGNWTPAQYQEKAEARKESLAQIKSETLSAQFDKTRTSTMSQAKNQGEVSSFASDRGAGQHGQTQTQAGIVQERKLSH